MYNYYMSFKNKMKTMLPPLFIWFQFTNFRMVLSPVLQVAAYVTVFQIRLKAPAGSKCAICLNISSGRERRFIIHVEKQTRTSESFQDVFKVLQEQEVTLVPTPLCSLLHQIQGYTALADNWASIFDTGKVPESEQRLPQNPFKTDTRNNM